MSFNVLIRFLCLCMIIFAQSSQQIIWDGVDANYLAMTFYNESSEESLTLFMDNVLKQYPSNLLMTKGRLLVDESGISDNQSFYPALKQSVDKDKAWNHFYTQIKSLRNQQQIIGEQLSQLIGNAPAEHYLEIGTQGTYINYLKQHHEILQADILSESKGVVDYLHGMSFSLFRGFKAYDNHKFYSENPSSALREISDNTYDVISMPAGLHHIPLEELPDLLIEIKRVLKPWGMFLLREHDLSNENKLSVYLAHTIFNMVSSSSSVEEEINEKRFFKPLEYWLALFNQAGFTDTNQRLKQAGDPTDNTMLKFQLDQTDNMQTILDSYPGYKRDFSSTLLTTPEWQNVLAADEYARFIHQTPWFEFPYIESITSYWSLFGKSWTAAREYESFSNLLFSEFTLMNVFVGSFMTIEYGLKAIIAAPVRWAISGDEPQEILCLVNDPDNEMQLISPKSQVVMYATNQGAALMQVPRYAKFKEMFYKLKDTNITFESIADNQQISMTVVGEPEAMNEMLSYPFIKELYTWGFPTREQPYYTLLVDVNKLSIVSQIIADQDIELFHIHDF